VLVCAGESAQIATAAQTTASTEPAVVN